MKNQASLTVLLAVAALLLAAVFPAAGAPRGDIAASIAKRLRQEADPDQSRHTLELGQTAFLARIYAVGDYAPLWQQPAQAEQFLALIAAVARDGLKPAEYHHTRLLELYARGERMPSTAAEFDILLTDAFARLAYHLRFGKANPHDIDPNWNFSRALITEDPASWLRKAIIEDRVEAALEWLRPQTPGYEVLRSALQHNREIVAAGGWPVVPDGETLKPGMDDPRIAILRLRLAARGGEGLPGVDSPTHFDPTLARAVREFQGRHGLIEDGFVGKQTRGALNVSAAARVDQLRVNLERIRWVFRDLEEEFLAVNIAAFHAALLRRGEIVWSARAVVGRTYRQTPIFKAAMTHVIFNPTWTVPPTILKKDVLPGMRKDPDYLRRKGLRVLNRDGVEVAAASIDWQHVRAAGFPYFLRQDPGPKNALGRVKFMFPNPHLVYLHDTPSRNLFDRAQRTFSSGCIRIERPLELAEILLEPNADWRRVDAQKILAAKHPRRFNLERPVTVMLLYLTAFAGEDGTIQFRRDIYDRDPAVLRALDGPFTFTPPEGYSAPP